MNFSIILASRSRVPLLYNFFESIKVNTKDIANVEVLVGIDDDDVETCQEENALKSKYDFVHFYKRKRSVNLNNDYLNWLVQFSKGSFLIACNDDIEVKTKDWDEIAVNSLNKYLEERPDRVVYGFLEDGLLNRQNMGYSCFPILSREAVNILGFLMPKEYHSWNADVTLWQIFSKIDRICYVPILFEHISYHSGKRERDNISLEVERRFNECRLYYYNYDINPYVDKLNLLITRKRVIPKKDETLISLLVYSREREELLRDFIKSAYDKSLDKNNIEILVAFDSDDKKTAEIIKKIHRNYGKFVKFYTKTRSSMINRDYYNWLMKFSKGKFIAMCNDDSVFMTDNWDTLVLDKFKDDELKLVQTNKEYSNTFFVSRKSVELLGFLANRDFAMYGSDIYLNRIYNSLNKIEYCNELCIEHKSYLFNRRPKDSVDCFFERISSRIPYDPVTIDISENLNKLTC